MNSYKIYAPLVLVMGILIFLLNYCTKIITCSFVFTLLMLTVHIISKIFGSKRALQTVSAYVAINVLLLSNYDYSINGVVFKYLIPASLLAVLLASIAFIKTVSLLENKVMAGNNNFFALVSAALIDGFAMFIYFINYIPVSSSSVIFFKESFFKCLYAFAIIAAIKLMSSIYSKHRLQNLKRLSVKN